MTLPSTRRGLMHAALAGMAGASLPAISASAQGAGGRTLKAVMHATLGVLDPFATTAYITRNHGYMVYDTLFAMDARMQPRPQMVQDWQISDDKLTYTFRLRDGLRFHDGAPVTAADCVASLQRWWKRDLMGTRLMNATASLEEVDARSFRLALKQPYGLVLETLAKPGGPVPFILPARLVQIPDTERINEVIGSGPFRFVAAEHRSGARVVYERFADYVPRQEPPSGLAGGKVAHFDRIEWLEITDMQTATSALQTGEIQIMEGVSPEMVQLLRRQRGIRLAPRGVGNTQLMRLNWLNPPFDRKPIRQAVLHAVSQPDYLAAQVGDDSLETVCKAFFTCTSPYATEVGAPAGPDLDRARALLKEGNYAGEEVVILHPADLPSGSALAPVTEQVLKSIGMKVRVDSMDWNSLLARRSRPVPIAEGGWSIAWGIWSDLDLGSPVVNLNADGRGRRGYVGWAESAEMERLRDAFATETDKARQMQLVEQMQRLAYEEVFAIPLGSYTVMMAHTEALKDVVSDLILVFWGMRTA
ncbi:ABC transporter substrate-binding protein [Pseudoroseomonas globiformis]|uniref:ABC transporter substrate-binding protein n=1 Tax=Teichococcus globiformis TaxID=2307229 RepID=A0ABV7G431_9PROT